MDAKGVLVGEARTDDSSIVILSPAPTSPNPPKPNLKITLAAADRPVFIGNSTQPVSIMGDLYRSMDGSEPSEWACRLPISLYPEPKDPCCTTGRRNAGHCCRTGMQGPLPKHEVDGAHIRF